MTGKRSAVTPKTRHRLWAAALAFALAAIGVALSVALGVHGFARGMLLGATLTLVLLGGVLLGLALAKKRGAPAVGEWLPSQDREA